MSINLELISLFFLKLILFISVIKNSLTTDLNEQSYFFPALIRSQWICHCGFVARSQTCPQRWLVANINIDARYKDAFYVNWNWRKIRNLCALFNFGVLLSLLIVGVSLLVQVLQSGGSLGYSVTAVTTVINHSLLWNTFPKGKRLHEKTI